MEKKTITAKVKLSKHSRLKSREKNKILLNEQYL